MSAFKLPQLKLPLVKMQRPDVHEQLQTIAKQHGLDQPAFAATIGNFDGVHYGHQALIKSAVDYARQHHCLSMAMFFEPHMKEHFASDEPPSRLMTMTQKIDAMAELGIQVACVFDDPQALVQVSAEAFLQNISEPFGLRHLAVGEDFRFGKKRTGSMAMLKQWAEEQEVQLAVIPEVRIANESVRSTRVRELLKQSDFELAAKLLSRPWCCQGEVIQGKKLARSLDAPTANLHLWEQTYPIAGVFACHVYVDGQRFAGVCNIGQRPTLEGAGPAVEAHIFDFDRDIYGEVIEVEPIVKLRDEKKFDSIDDLRNQIKQDIAQARQLHTATGIEK